MAERLAALVVLALSGAYLALGLPLPRGVSARPGPGFFPLLVGIFLCGTALAFVVETFRRSPRASTPWGAAGLSADARWRVAATGAALVGFCLLLPWLGYPVVTLAFVTLLLRSLGAAWTAATVSGLASAAASYYLFGVLLGVPLPRGVLFE